MGQEVELKLVFTEVISLDDIVRKISQVLDIPDLKRQSLRNIYFDTADVALNAAKIALRIRDNNGQFIQTLKTKGQAVDGLHQRGEWEWPLERAELDFDVLRRNPNWSSEIDPHALRPVFETNFIRHCCDIEYSGVRMELALDNGEILAGGKREVLMELELELLSGNPSALLELGEKLKHCLPLESSDISKAERGYRLARS